MERSLKQRLVGGAVLVALGVIFIPVLLDGSGYRQQHPPIPGMPAEPVLPEPLPLNQTPIELQPRSETAGSAQDAGNTEDTAEQTLSAWVVQLGSFSQRDNADALTQSLRGEGFNAFIEEIDSAGSASFRVRVGPELTRDEIERVQQRLQNESGQRGVIMRYSGPGS